MKRVNNYNFQKISTLMARDFGKIEEGKEDQHFHILFNMESNMLKVARQNPKCGDRRALEAIRICLFQINGRLNKIEYDLSEHINYENERLVHALSMSFDPFVNEQIHAILEKKYDLQDASVLKEYYKSPIRALLRVESSIELWMKKLGINGYFTFIDNQIGQLVEQNDEMTFSFKFSDNE